jgi:isopentenyl diphosphate isomerase/L-lactate dehydrogenase-like FMN-dependent dehydrogenase
MEEGQYLLSKIDTYPEAYICLDMANGHMEAQIDLGKELKTKNPGVKIMGGNIANPRTYRYYDAAGFDYVRVSIGSGSGCLSSVQTAIHYPMASLLDEIDKIRKNFGSQCKVIADGGMTGYSDIIKALALGADYVMAGLIFAKAATGEEKVGDELEYYGMSTKRAQKEMGRTTLKTSEGKFLSITKEYTLSGWAENMDSYLRSAMSYCDSRTLTEFREKVEIHIVSNETIKSIGSK